MTTKVERIVLAAVVAAFIAAAVLTIAGCTDAQRSKMFALGDSGRVTCWSGGTVIYDGRSTGKVLSEQNSDGYFFRDAADGMLKEASGDCVIVYGE